MAYSIVGIINLGLSNIGSLPISIYPDTTTVQGIKATAVWEYIRDEVLEVKDWAFAKKRYKLVKNTDAPQFTWDYAYTLPPDFLGLCKGTKQNPPVYPLEKDGKILYPWIIEPLDDGTLCLLTNYDNSIEDIYINYIARVIDPRKYTAQFINALGLRLGAQLSLSLTKDPKLFPSLMNAYRIAVSQAEILNLSLDSMEDEKGNSDWEEAGRD